MKFIHHRSRNLQNKLLFSRLQQHLYTFKYLLLSVVYDDWRMNFMLKWHTMSNNLSLYIYPNPFVSTVYFIQFGLLYWLSPLKMGSCEQAYTYLYCTWNLSRFVIVHLMCNRSIQVVKNFQPSRLFFYPSKLKIKNVRIRCKVNFLFLFMQW